MTEESDIEVRFIEYMPFDDNRWENRKMVSYFEMLDRIRQVFPEFQRQEVRTRHKLHPNCRDRLS